MLNRAGSTKNIVGFAAKADKKERHRVRQLTPEEIAELQARLSSDPARFDPSHLRPFPPTAGPVPDLDPDPTFPLPSPPQEAFNLFDTDHSGTIDERELKVAMRALESACPPRKLPP